MEVIQIGPKPATPQAFKALHLSHADLTPLSPKSENYWALHLEGTVKNHKAILNWVPLCPTFPRSHYRDESKGSEDSPHPGLS